MSRTLPTLQELPLSPEDPKNVLLDATDDLSRSLAEPEPTGTTTEETPIAAASSPLVPESGVVDHGALAAGLPSDSAPAESPSILGEQGTLSSSFDSIPQSTAIPGEITDVFRDPEEDARLAEEEALRKQNAQRYLNVFRAATEGHAYYQEQGIDFSYARDPEAAMKSATAKSYMIVRNGGQPLPEDPLAQDLFLATILREDFGIKGGGTRETLYDQLAKKGQNHIDRNTLGSDLTRQAETSALIQYMEGGKDSRKATRYPQWLRDAQSKPGYDSENNLGYYEKWNAAQQRIKEQLEQFGPELERVWKAVKENPNEIPQGNYPLTIEGYYQARNATDRAAVAPDAADIAFEIYNCLAPEHREPFINSLGVLSRTLTEDQQATFLSNLAKQTDRNLRDLQRQTVHGGLALVYQGIDAAFEATDPTPEERLFYLEDYEKGAALRRFNGARDFSDKVRKIQREYDPVKKLWGDGILGDIEQGLYEAPGVAATALVYTTPYVGPLIMATSMNGYAYDDMRDRLIQQDTDPALASEIASRYSAPIAALQIIPERLGLKFLTGRVPRAEKIFDGIGDRITNGVARHVSRTLIRTAGETGTEIVEDLVPLFVQETASAFGEAIPGVDLPHEFEGFWSKQITTFVSVLPLTLAGLPADISREARHKTFAEASTTQRLAYGITPEHSAAIDAALEKGPSSLGTAIDLALEHRDPNSESARTAVEELERTARAEQEATEWLQMYGFLPRAEREADGKWTLYDSRSNEIIGTATNAEEAARMASTHAKLEEEQHADQIARITTAYQAAEATGQWATENGRNQTTELDLSGKLTVEGDPRMTTHARNRAAAQERLKGGDGSITRLIFGQSTTETEDGLRKTVNRILGGGSILTVLHEDAHALRREAHARGVLTREDDIAIIRAVDAVLDGKTVRNKKGMEQDSTTRLSLLPENFDSLPQADQDVAIDEAISELMEAEIIRTRKGGGARQLPAGIISRNMAAIARLAGPKAAGKFGSFIEAFRSYFGLATDLAHHIRRGLADGSLDQAGYDAHFGKLTEKDADANERASLGGRDSAANSNSSGRPDTAKDGNNSLSHKLRSIFANPPSNYNFEPYHESRARIRRIAAENGIELVRGTDTGSGETSDLLDSRIRDICEAQGVEILFYRGSSSKIAGFTPRSNPDLIFINTNPKRSDLPLGWTIAHELLHVAQKDSASGAKELGKQIEDLLTPEELADFHTVLGEHYGTDEYATELPAFLAGDAISGHSVFDLHALENASAITDLITGFFDGLGKLNPSSLEASDDSELATLPDQDNSPENSSSRPSQDIPTEDETSPSKGESDQAASLRIVSDRGGFRVIDAQTGNEIGFKKSYEDAVALANEHGGTLEDGCDIYLYFKRGWDEDQQQAAQDKARMLDEGDTVARSTFERDELEQKRYRIENDLDSKSDADHRIDLQLGGKTTRDNIWTLDKSVNRSIGAQIQNRIRKLPDGTRINKVHIKHR